MIYERMFLAILLATQYTITSQDTFTAVIKVEECARVETLLVGALHKYIYTEEEENRTVPVRVRTFVNKLQKHFERNESAESIAQNPLSAFHLIDRYVNGWMSFMKCSSCLDCWLFGITDSSNELCRRLLKIKEENDKFPDHDDLMGSASALIRLSDMYGIDFGQIIDGRFINVTSEPLSATQVLYISNVAQGLGKFPASMVLLEKIYNRTQTNRDRMWPDGTLADIYTELASLYHRHGLPDKSLEIVQDYLDIDPQNTLVQDILEWYIMDRLERPEATRDPEIEPQVITEENYKELCRGQILRDAAEISGLKCFFRDTGIPIIKSKEEVLNYDPRISLFHDVISDTESTIVKNLAFKELERSGVVRADQADPALSDRRISQTSWLNDIVHPTVKKLSLRIANIVGMKMECKDIQSDCEYFQTLNYGIGGMFKPHYDYLSIINDENLRHLEGSGNRLATWLFYLTDVEAGGSTVFPSLKVEVPVTKGGAAFWFNAKRNGELDNCTMHAGCPVLLGSKWVCSKWIRSHSQMFSRPCGLTEDALDGPQS